MYNMKMLASIEQRNQEFANLIGSRMQQMEQRQPHIIYKTITEGKPPQVVPPTPIPSSNPREELLALERRLEQEKRSSKVRLHEATASARESVNRQVLELQGEV